MSEDRQIEVRASTWQWHQTKNWLHFYTLVGAIPAAIMIFYANVFIGPATLEPIPEDYVPKYWEYYRHPISRFIARYLQTNPQQEYEKLCHYIYMEGLYRDINQMTNLFQMYSLERQDNRRVGFAHYYGSQAVHKIRKEFDEVNDER